MEIIDQVKADNPSTAHGRGEKDSDVEPWACERPHPPMGQAHLTAGDNCERCGMPRPIAFPLEHPKLRSCSEVAADQENPIVTRWYVAPGCLPIKVAGAVTLTGKLLCVGGDVLPMSRVFETERLALEFTLKLTKEAQGMWERSYREIMDRIDMINRGQVDVD